jgi:hypothetical protein
MGRRKRLREQATAAAIKAVIADQIAAAIKERGLSKCAWRS